MNDDDDDLYACSINEDGDDILLTSDDVAMVAAEPGELRETAQAVADTSDAPVKIWRYRRHSLVDYVRPQAACALEPVWPVSACMQADVAAPAPAVSRLLEPIYAEWSATVRAIEDSRMQMAETLKGFYLDTNLIASAFAGQNKTWNLMMCDILKRWSFER